MSDVMWDADDFVPAKATPVLPSDKWEGEDEDDVKDNWDDEDEEKQSEGDATTTTTTTASQIKRKKKKLADIIAEKEARQVEELERRRKEAEEKSALQSAESKLAEKLRLQQVQEDADLELATELMGSTSSVTEEENKLLDHIDISTPEGLISFRKALVAKVRATDRLEKRPVFVTFVEDLSRDLCQNLEVDEVKRVTGVLNTLYNEKMRASKPKNKKKAMGKAKLNVGQGAIADDYTNDYGNEYDDFI